MNYEIQKTKKSKKLKNGFSGSRQKLLPCLWMMPSFGEINSNSCNYILFRGKEGDVFAVKKKVVMLSTFRYDIAKLMEAGWPFASCQEFVYAGKKSTEGSA